MSELYIGLMTGTSMDGIDVAIVEFDNSHSPHSIYSHTSPFPAELVHELHALCQPGHNDLEQSQVVAQSYSRAVANSVLDALSVANIQSQDISAIGNHGQTIRHCPERGFSIQLGDHQALAIQTGIAVIGDFRQKDLAFGGQGAPLAPAFHQALWRNNQSDRVVLNLGGIANISVLPADPAKSVYGYDTGPANTLLDLWYRKHNNGQFDMHGQWGQRGAVIQPLLQAMLADDYFAQAAPKSTGREKFNLQWLSRFQPEQYSAQDVQATLAALTVESIAREIEKGPCNEVILCGGGCHNRHLIKQLSARLARCTLRTSTELGVMVDDVEAMLFAWLAYCHMHNIPSNLPAVTGASKATSLGIFYSPE